MPTPAKAPNGRTGRPPVTSRAAILAAARQLISTWPWAVEILTADGFVGLLDDAALWPVEAIVAGAVEAGCTHEQAVVLFRSVWYYTVGEILVRARSPHRTSSGETPRFDFPNNLDPALTPQLTAIGADWKTYAAGDTFPIGLSALVDGLLAQATT